MPPITIRSEGLTTREVTRVIDGQQVTHVVPATVMSGKLAPRVIDLAVPNDPAKVVSFEEASRKAKALIAASEVSPMIGAQIVQGPKAALSFEAQIEAIRQKAANFAVSDTAHDGSAALTNKAVTRSNDTQIG